MEGSLLLKEVLKKIDNKHMSEIFKSYLSNVTDVSTLSDEHPILKEAHKIFICAQRMLDDMACAQIQDTKDLDIVMAYALYSGVCVILKENDLEWAVEIFEDANLKMNVPRDDEEENAEFFEALRVYYTNFYIPLRVKKNNISMNEYDFALQYYKNKKWTIPEFIVNKGKEVNCAGLEKELLTMCLN